MTLLAADIVERFYTFLWPMLRISALLVTAPLIPVFMVFIGRGAEALHAADRSGLDGLALPPAAKIGGQLGGRRKSRRGHPLNGIAGLVTATLLRIDQDVDREGRRPGRTRPRLVQKPIFNDQPPAWRQMSQDLFHKCGIGLKRLVVQNVRHQNDIIGTAQTICIEISWEQCNTRLQPGFFHRLFRQP